MADILLIGTTKLLTYVGANIASIGTDMVVKTFSLTTHGILHMSRSFFTDTRVGFREFQAMENEIDLMETVKLYEAYIKEYIETHTIKYEQSPTIQMAITSIHTTLEEIHALLVQIDTKIKEAEQRWRITKFFYGPPVFTREIATIIAKKNILENRFNIFIKISRA